MSFETFYTDIRKTAFQRLIGRYAKKPVFSPRSILEILKKRSRALIAQFPLISSCKNEKKMLNGRFTSIHPSLWIAPEKGFLKEKHSATQVSRMREQIAKGEKKREIKRQRPVISSRYLHNWYRLPDIIFEEDFLAS